MRRLAVAQITTLVLLAASAFAQAPPTASRQAPAGPPKPAPRLADGRIDFSGLWRPADIFLIEDISLGLKPGETVPLNAWAQDVMKTHLSKNDPEANCLPMGVPRQAPYPWKFAEVPGYIYMLFEGNIHSFRQVFMDGRAHPADPNPTWYGHSTGRWDKDTLVIDTVGFNDKFWFDMAGHPHTTQLHVIERYHRRDFGNLDIGITIEDSGTYTKPWTIQRVSTLETGIEMSEYVCNENNSDVLHLVGK